MTTTHYASDRTGLLFVGPTTIFSARAAKLWPLLKEIAEEEHLLTGVLGTERLCIKSFIAILTNR
jgi:hypothetical protein